MSVEVGEFKDPLTIINQSASEINHFQRYISRVSYGVGAALTGLALARVNGSVPDLIFLTAAAATVAYPIQSSVRQAIRLARNPWIKEEQVEAAEEELKTDGKSLSEDISLKGYSVYELAQKIRATKLLLARRGQLEEYRRFVWLNHIEIPESLKPTQDEIEEVEEYFTRREGKLNKFVDDLKTRNNVLIECGDGFSQTDTKVYLFDDKRDPFINRSFPLVEVMRVMGANGSQLDSTNVFTRILNETGFSLNKQQITDFFGKKTIFYIGAQNSRHLISVYGVEQLATATQDSLPEYFLRSQGFFIDPFARLIHVEPTISKVSTEP